MIIVKLFGGLGNQMFQYAGGVVYRSDITAINSSIFPRLARFPETHPGITQFRYSISERKPHQL